MQGNLFRWMLILAAVVISLINIYPTIGWMTLTDEQRLARLEKWEQEDTERARERQGAWSDLVHLVKRWSEFDRDRVINLGLDLQGGIHMVLSFDINELEEERLADYRERKYADTDIQQEVQQMVLEQVRRRVHDFETDEPLIQTLGTNQIQVQLPGEKDLKRVQDLIKKTAVLNFHIVAGPDEEEQVIRAIKAKYPEFVTYLDKQVGDFLFSFSAEDYEKVAAVLEKVNAEGSIIPEGKIVRFSKPPKPYEDQKYSLYILDEEPIQSGEGLSSAAAIPDQQNPPFWQILFQFSNEAGANFGKVTEQNRGRAMAILVDDVVISAPSIRDRITTNGQITGNFDAEDAVDLAIALNSGSMVVPLNEEFSRVIGATLGADSVRKGVTSAIIGLIVVAVFMIFYYLAAGVISVIALFLNAIFIVAAMAYFDLTLTLPGIAGLILTIGMAVDANVLIFERIREELRLGHSLASSIQSGFDRATVTILDANITTLIAALVLFQFGTGPIEGFAITLSIGVCTSVFAALVVSRAMFEFLLNRRMLRSLKMLSMIKPDAHIQFMRYWKLAVSASLLVIMVGMGWFIMRGKDNFGVDFTEGTNLDLVVKAEKEIPVDDVRVALANAGFAGAIVQRSMEDPSQPNGFLIRVSETDLADSKESAVTESAAENATATQQLTFVSERIKEALKGFAASGSPDDIQILSEQTVGPAAGSQLRYDALRAVLFSIVLIMIYLGFRFQVRYSVGAVAALTHDVLITVGIMSMMGREISLTVIAALLTIIGYSLNDTIVIFDRIREDLALHRGKGKKLNVLMDEAISATMSRTLLTAATTLFVVVVLYFFGGVAINDFALALFIGIVVGTYSSIYIASPVVYAVQEFINRRRGLAETANSDKQGSGKGKKHKKGSGEKAPA